MKLLVDRQHADLLYSIQRLFEDRLGVEVYVPVGHEWWGEGYWRFGQGFGDDRLAQQFLVMREHEWEDEGSHFITYDTSHPERAIRGVTREQFRAMDWTFVMCSVPDNQQGFARLAGECGARYLYHIGNTGQFADFRLKPTIINTSEFQVPEGVGVTIHQEIDSGPGGDFAYRPMSGREKTISSFVNNFNRLPPGYAAFLEVEKLMPDWKFYVYGHEGRDGFVTPAGHQADKMAASSFGWHDKPVGDGFGHVIHGWAAVGRPLIGRASFYRGKMAEPFWTPETSINLDGMSLSDAVRAIKGFHPDTIAEMGANIRAVFDRLVNYEAEADSVRALLGL